MDMHLLIGLYPLLLPQFVIFADGSCVDNLTIHINNVTEVEPVVLLCQPTPGSQCLNSMKSVTWMRYTYDEFEDAFVLYSNKEYNGSRLTNNVDYNGRTVGRLTPKYAMTIETSKLEDNGQWKCMIRVEGDDTHESKNATVVVSANNSTININMIPPEYILLGSISEYKCLCDRVYPDVNVAWMVNGVRYSNGSTDYTYDGDAIYSLKAVNDFLFLDRDNIEVKCILENTYGQPWKKEAISDEVQAYAPASFVDYKFSHNKPTPNDTLSMTCTVSGTQHQQLWFFNGTVLNKDTMFEEQKVEIDGEFDFGEATATNSTLVWKVNIGERSCEFLNAFNGVYQCRATAEKGPTIESDEDDVTVMYAPILKKTEDEENYARVNDTVTMSCEILCASPSEVTYTWTSENNRGGLEQNKDVIYITLTEDDFDDTFTCIVDNTIGTPTKKFVFNKIVETTADLTTYGDTTVDIGTAEPSGSANREALVIANAVIWSLCGVVAVVLVCLALYHYRQIQNGKEYHGDYSEDKILTNEEVEPGTSQGFGSDEYHDISHSDVGKEAVGGAVGGNGNEGLYAEVKTPSQKQMPVAPKRASKVQTPQPQPSTPKAKQTHPINAPKSPMDARHQPDRRPEPKADYSPVFNGKEILQKHSNESNHGMASTVEQQQKRHEMSNKSAAVKQKTNGAKPSVPDKPNITTFRSSRSSGLNPVGAAYDNAEVNLYANCDQRPVQKNGDGTITYADLALHPEDPYNEGAPPVPTKNMNDQDPVQYASIKHVK